MMRKAKVLQLLGGLAVLTAVGTMLMPANAQMFDRRYPSLQRERGGGGFFDGLFGGRRQRPDEREVYRERDVAPAPSDFSRAPAPPRKDKSDIEPTTSIVVLGDSMADWLASGLEDAFGDAPEIGIVRKNKQFSGLLRYDARNDLDWWHVAKDLLANEKPTYVVMMIGVADRGNLRERDVAKDAEQQAKEQAAAAAAVANPAQPGAAPADQQKPDQAKKETDDEGGIVAPEPKPTARRIASANGVIEFRTDAWEKVYARRIDDTIAALKSKGVPVIWVGLPPIRGTKSTADTSYLNDLYRARAEKAGAIYVDVWDGFVDEEGKYTNSGPDYEGQMRRLRAGDGVYFTKFGARKLAHYVEREVRRLMTNRGPIALPMGPAPALQSDGNKSAVRPLAGPVVPLTSLSGGNDELVGGSNSARADATASAVLVKGDAVAVAPGRADDFIWPPGSERKKIDVPVAAPAVAPVAPAPQATAVAPVAVPAPVAPAAPLALAPPAANADSATTNIMKPEPAPQARPEPRPAQAAVEPAARTAPAPRAVQQPRPQQQQVFDPRAQQQRPPQQQQFADPRQRPPPQQQFDPRAPRPPQGFAQQPQQRRNDGGLFGVFR